MNAEPYLERVLAREALITVTTRERLDGKMYPLMPLQIVIAVEALRTLVAPEWAIILWVRLWWVAIHLVHLGCVATVVATHHAVLHAADQSKLSIRVADVGQDWSG